MEELDNNFSSLVQSKAVISLTEPGKMNALKALLNKNIPKENIKKDEFSDVQNLQTSNQVCFCFLLVLSMLVLTYYVWC